MGGALALHTGFHVHPEIRGVFACSSFLNNDSIVYESLKTRNSNDGKADLIMFHGDRDTLVPLEWGQRTLETKYV